MKVAKLPRYSGMGGIKERSFFQSSGNTSPTTETPMENRKRTSYVPESLVLTRDPVAHHLYEISASESQ